MELAILRNGSPTARQALEGVSGLSKSYSREERAKLRRHGIITLVQDGDRFFVSGSVSTAGTAMMATRTADRIVETLTDTDPKIDDPAFIATLTGGSNQHCPALEWRWMLYYGDLCLGQDDDLPIYLILPGPS